MVIGIRDVVFFCYVFVLDFKGLILIVKNEVDLELYVCLKYFF